MKIDRGTVVGHVYDKYRTRHPAARWLVGRFLSTVKDLCDLQPNERVVEIGTGEGDLLARIVTTSNPKAAWGTDLSPVILCEAAERHASLPLRFLAQSAYALALRRRSVDRVIACEVLEHLESPEEALREIARVVCLRAVLSVPREPLWRWLNLARLRYVAALGNTPGHVQHYSRDSFVALVEKHLRIVAVRTPLPWIVVAAEPRD